MLAIQKEISFAVSLFDLLVQINIITPRFPRNPRVLPVLEYPIVGQAETKWHPKHDTETTLTEVFLFSLPRICGIISIPVIVDEQIRKKKIDWAWQHILVSRLCLFCQSLQLCHWKCNVSCTTLSASPGEHCLATLPALQPSL